MATPSVSRQPSRAPSPTNLPNASAVDALVRATIAEDYGRHQQQLQRSVNVNFRTDAQTQADEPPPDELVHAHQRVWLFYNLLQHYLEDNTFPFEEEWVGPITTRESEASEARAMQAEDEALTGLRAQVAATLSAPAMTDMEKAEVLAEVAKKQKLLLLRRMRRIKVMTEAQTEMRRERLVDMNRMAMETTGPGESASKSAGELARSISGLLGKLFVHIRACIAKDRVPRPSGILWYGERKSHFGVGDLEGYTTDAWPEDLSELLELGAMTDGRFAALKEAKQRAAVQQCDAQVGVPSPDARSAAATPTNPKPLSRSSSMRRVPSKTRRQTPPQEGTQSGKSSQQASPRSKRETPVADSQPHAVLSLGSQQRTTPQEEEKPLPAPAPVPSYCDTATSPIVFGEVARASDALRVTFMDEQAVAPVPAAPPQLLQPSGTVSPPREAACSAQNRQLNDVSPLGVQPPTPAAPQPAQAPTPPTIQNANLLLAQDDVQPQPNPNEAPVMPQPTASKSPTPTHSVCLSPSEGTPAPVQLSCFGIASAPTTVLPPLEASNPTPTGRDAAHDPPRAAAQETASQSPPPCQAPPVSDAASKVPTTTQRPHVSPVAAPRPEKTSRAIRTVAFAGGTDDELTASPVAVSPPPAVQRSPPPSQRATMSESPKESQAGCGLSAFAIPLALQTLQSNPPRETAQAQRLHELQTRAQEREATPGQASEQPRAAVLSVVDDVHPQCPVKDYHQNLYDQFKSAIEAEKSAMAVATEAASHAAKAPQACEVAQQPRQAPPRGGMQEQQWCSTAAADPDLESKVPAALQPSSLSHPHLSPVGATLSNGTIEEWLDDVGPPAATQGADAGPHVPPRSDDVGPLVVTQPFESNNLSMLSTFQDQRSLAVVLSAAESTLIASMISQRAAPSAQPPARSPQRAAPSAQPPARSPQRPSLAGCGQLLLNGRGCTQ